MPDRFEELLQQLQELEVNNAQEFELQATKLFAEYIDDEGLNLYHQPTFQTEGTHLRPDAMISKSRSGKPLFIVEVKLTHQEGTVSIRDEWLEQVRTYVEATDAEYGILLSNSTLTILDGTEKILIDIRNPNKETINKSREILNSTDPTDEKRQLSKPQSEKKIESQYFSLQYAKFEEAVDMLDKADSLNKKGKVFEDLAALLFGGIDFLTVRDKQLRTNTSEIDVVVEYDGYSEKTIFDEYSRFIIAECKNWSGTVGVPQIRDFKGKMDKSYTDFGVIFAREGISGDEGADAIRWIHDYFQREGGVILVIDDDEIARLRSGESFYSILDDLLYERRFDFN